MLKISNVQKNSLAEELGFEIGDAITHINGYKVIDILDYLYAEAQTEFTLTVLTKNGEEVELEIEPLPLKYFIIPTAATANIIPTAARYQYFTGMFLICSTRSKTLKPVFLST